MFVTQKLYKYCQTDGFLVKSKPISWYKYFMKLIINTRIYYNRNNVDMKQ
jgi:hypothetical protein